MRLFGALLAITVLAATARAAPNIEEQVRDIARELRCPVCQGGSVAESTAALAEEMRGVIRAKLEAGETPEAIKAYFVSKYGDWILLEPPRRGTGLLVWAIPVLAVLGGAAYLASVMRRWRSEPRPVILSEDTDDPYVQRVRREVARLEGRR